MQLVLSISGQLYGQADFKEYEGDVYYNLTVHSFTWLDDQFQRHNCRSPQRDGFILLQQDNYNDCNHLPQGVMSLLRLLNGDAIGFFCYVYFITQPCMLDPLLLVKLCGSFEPFQDPRKSNFASKNKIGLHLLVQHFTYAIFSSSRKA